MEFEVVIVKMLNELRKRMNTVRSLTVSYKEPDLRNTAAEINLATLEGINS